MENLVCFNDNNLEAKQQNDFELIKFSIYEKYNLFNYDLLNSPEHRDMSSVVQCNKSGIESKHIVNGMAWFPIYQDTYRRYGSFSINMQSIEIDNPIIDIKALCNKYK